VAIELDRMLDESRIVDLASTTKEDALRELVDVLSKAPEVTDRDALLHAILEREKIISTGVGIEVAMPHAKISSVTDFCVAIGRSQKGIDFDAIDDKPVHIVVMIGSNDKQIGDFLKVLALLVRRFKNKDFRRQIMFAKNAKKVRELFLSDDFDEDGPES
jgi:fructose-specific phosphotransferase system IIA component